MTGLTLIGGSAFASVHGVFNSTAFQIARNVTLFFVAVFWLGLAYWVYRDARRRVDDGWLVGTATLLGLVPFLGPLVYLLFRPPETLEEAHLRRAEVHALETRLGRSQPACPVCRTDVEAGFLICPVCTTHLKEPCVACSAPLEPLWQACPYCATPVPPKAVPDPVDAVPVDALQVDPVALDSALAAEAVLHGNAAPARRRARKAS